MSNKLKSPYPLRMGEDLKMFIDEMCDKSGRSKNAVIKACLEVARENKAQLFKRTGVSENAKTAQ